MTWNRNLTRVAFYTRFCHFVLWIGEFTSQNKLSFTSQNIADRKFGGVRHNNSAKK